MSAPSACPRTPGRTWLHRPGGALPRHAAFTLRCMAVSAAMVRICCACWACAPAPDCCCRCSRKACSASPSRMTRNGTPKPSTITSTVASKSTFVECGPTPPGSSRPPGQRGQVGGQALDGHVLRFCARPAGLLYRTLNEAHQRLRAPRRTARRGTSVRNSARPAAPGTGLQPAVDRAEQLADEAHAHVHLGRGHGRPSCGCSWSAIRILRMAL